MAPPSTCSGSPAKAPSSRKGQRKDCFRVKKEMMIEKVEPITAFPKQGGFQFLQQEIKIALASSKKDIG